MKACDICNREKNILIKAMDFSPYPWHAPSTIDVCIDCVKDDVSLEQIEKAI